MKYTKLGRLCLNCVLIKRVIANPGLKPRKPHTMQKWNY